MLVDELSAKWPVKISDFGFSAKIQSDELLYEAFGTPYYTAPEVIWRRGYSCACDVWSLGIVLYIVLFGFPPFAQTDHQALFLAIGRGKFTFPEGTRVSDDARDAVSKMLVVTPSERITAGNLLQHRWFTERPAASTPLPTDQLRTFNARRKVKGGFLGVTTTFHLWSLIGSRRPAAPNAKAKAADEKALKDVQDVMEPETYVEPRHAVPRVKTTPSGALVLPSGALPSALSPSSLHQKSEVAESVTVYESSIGLTPLPNAESSGAGGSGPPPRAQDADIPVAQAHEAASTAWVPPTATVAVAASGVKHLSDLERRTDLSFLPPAPADTGSSSSGASSVFPNDVGDTVGGSAEPSQSPTANKKQAHFAPGPGDGPDQFHDDSHRSSSDDSFQSVRDMGIDTPSPAPDADVVDGDSPQSVVSRRRSLLLGEVAAGSPPHTGTVPTELDEELRNMLDHAETDGVDHATSNPFFASGANGEAGAEAAAATADDKLSAPLRRIRVSGLSAILNIGRGGSASLPATPSKLTEVTPVEVEAPGVPPLRVTHTGDNVGGAVAANAPLSTAFDAQAPRAAPLSPPGGPATAGTHSRSDILHAVRSEVQAVSTAPETEVTPTPPPPRRSRRLAPLDLRQLR